MKPHDELDVVAGKTAQELVDVADPLVEVEHPETDGFLPAEVEQLPRQRQSTDCRPANLLDVLADETGRVELLDRHFGELPHDVEDVVEVVRHGARQASEGLHLLRLPVLFFGGAQRVLGGLPVPHLRPELFAKR